MTTAADYQGRQIDIAAFRGMLPGGPEQLLAQELVTPRDGGAVVAGIQWLAQTVLMVLLLKQGTKAHRPLDGCQFMVDAELGRWRTVADVEQSFYLSRVDVQRQVQAAEDETDPPDECYGALRLAGVTLAGGTVTVRVELESLAGTTYTFLTPITVTVR